MRRTDDQVLSIHDLAEADEPARERLLDVLHVVGDALRLAEKLLGALHLLLQLQVGTGTHAGCAQPLGAVVAP
mgnify:CR=1 FL=1